MDYRRYIESSIWKEKREELFKLIGKKCEQCGSNKKIQVHHLTYKNFGNEKFNELQVLCDICHAKKHKNHKVFKKVENNKKWKSKNKPLKIRDSELLKMDFKELTISHKKRCLKLRGYKFN